ncbi:TFIIB-type zinc ribbon-containing protein [Candidatus Saccharibacteria bacterium]|nr:TFIIB-type zinc ribbon-containing protein [Candidatus Saccharibacteria bacterium]
MVEAKAKNGMNRCPKCGATDTSLDLKSGKLKCNYCRALFDATSANGATDISQLKGRKVSGGAKDIIPDKKTIVTFKCPACGAEVVINADEATSAKCHWCRHVFGINEQIENGAVPDMVLPFKLDKATGEKKIREFVEKRQFYAHPVFKKEFTTENTMGVYLPYMVVDVNAHASLSGQAEHQTRSYTVQINNRTVRYYDADLYNVARDFDIVIDDLTVEASKDKLNQNSLINTTNVINAIMPFDTENCVSWNANYLRGFASEKRDANVEDVSGIAKAQAQDIARFKVKETMEFYDRGAVWSSESIDVKGAEWKSAYLPIWLYSYLEKKDDKKLLHYVAVNARDGKTMGSVPIYTAKLLAVSIVIEVLSIVLGFFWAFIWFSDDDSAYAGFLSLFPGFVYYFIIKNKYRNMNARNKHESNTKSEISNVKKSDTFVEKRTRLRNSQIEGKNSDDVKGTVAKMNKNGFMENISSKVIEEIKNQQ